jgi:microcystin degradation protein MlrC
MRARIAIAGILHESNTFAATQTTYADFERSGLTRGEQIIEQWAPSTHEVGGFIEGAARYQFDMYPAIVAQATPFGVVTDDALDCLTGELIERLTAAPKLDGLLLALHGAMVAQSYPHADTEILGRLRAALGPAFCIVVTHDFHANITQELVDRTTALAAYKTCPHVDQHACGLKAAEIVSRIVRGEIQPVQALAKPPMIYNILFHNTTVEPLQRIVDECRALERNRKIVAASVAGGYQYADVPAMGPSAVVVTDRDPELAQREAQRLAGLLWETRDRLVVDLPDAAQAVCQAIASDRSPVVLVEMGDNIGGGSAGDSTFLLSELLRQNAQGWFEVIADPQAVELAARAGVGHTLELPVGGRTDSLHGAPVDVRGRVKSIHDGKYIETEVRHGGQRYLDQGLTAVIQVEGSTRDLPNLLMLTTRRQPPFSLQQLLSCGVCPERQKILVVKAAIAYRAAYEPIAARIIEVDTGGATAVSPAHFTWRRVRPGLFGMK